MLTMPVIFLFYKENGLGTQDLFILKAVYSVSIVIMEIPSGYFGDAWGRKNTLITGSILGFSGFGLYCFVSGFWGFLLCEMMLGIGQSFISGSDSALLYDTLLEAEREDEYLKIEGRLISMGNYAEAVAAPIGVLLAAISLRTTFCFQAAVAFSAVPAALLLMEPKRTGILEKASFQNIISIIRYALIQNRTLKWNIIYSSIIGTATLTMAWFIQPYFVFLALPLALYGLVIPILNLSAGTMSMYAYLVEKRVGRTKTTLFIALAIPSPYMVLGCFQTLWALGFLFLFYIVRGIATPVLRNYINENTPSEIRATVLSIRSLMIRLAFVILGPFLGWYADQAGLPSTLIVAGIVFLTAGVISTVYLIKEPLPETVKPIYARDHP